MSRWFELAQAIARADLARNRVMTKVREFKAKGFSRERAKTNFDIYEAELDEIYGKSND